MKKLLIIIILSGVNYTANSQMVVSDFMNLLQNIINSVNEIGQSGKTTHQMWENFQETRKIYDQAREQFDGLKNVSNHVRNYRKVASCIGIVGDITDTYLSNYDKMLRDDNFSAKELSAIGHVYNNILRESGSALSEIQQTVISNSYVMSDAERLERIDKLHKELEGYRRLTNSFTRRNIAISMYRAKEKNDVKSLVEFYGHNSEKYW